MLRNALLSGLVLATLAHAARDYTCPSDPYADPSADTCNPFRYIPSKSINILALVLYFIVAVLLTWRAIKWRANYFLALVIGAYFEGLGIALRLALRTNLHSSGLYTVMYLFVVLSPCAFLAGDYILLGRIVGHLDAARHLRPLRPQYVSYTFIISDIITFLIQAAGGGLSTSHNVKQAETGGHIFLAGIAAQMASFTFFMFMWLVYFWRLRRRDPELYSRAHWKPLFFALGFSSICFEIRSVYRTVELSQGYIGYLATHERYFFGLDTLPLWLGISVYVLFWPGAWLTSETRVAPAIEGTETAAGDQASVPSATDLAAEPKESTLTHGGAQHGVAQGQ